MSSINRVQNLFACSMTVISTLDRDYRVTNKQSDINSPPDCTGCWDCVYGVRSTQSSPPLTVNVTKSLRHTEKRCWWPIADVVTCVQRCSGRGLMDHEYGKISDTTTRNSVCVPDWTKTVQSVWQWQCFHMTSQMSCCLMSYPGIGMWRPWRRQWSWCRTCHRSRSYSDWGGLPYPVR